MNIKNNTQIQKKKIWGEIEVWRLLTKQVEDLSSN